VRTPLTLIVLLTLVVAPTASAQDWAQIREYRNSGEWDRDISAATNRAKAYIAKRIRARRVPPKPALVLDVDDTSLDNYPCIDAGDPQSANVLGLLINCWVRFDVPAVDQTRSLFRRARRLGIKVFFVTGRFEPFRKGTRDNLRSAGYRTPFELVMRPAEDHRPSVVPFKRSARRAIGTRGFTILANLGDQRSDLQGGFAERRYRLPNPMYTLP
jgi:predicted secreted acid phosphatase